MDLYEGATIEVIVSSVENYGVVVSYEDQKGILLETNIDWDCDGMHSKMFDLFKPGQKLNVKVLAVTPTKFSASIKHLHPEKDPWRDPSIYTKGTLHCGVVKLMFDFGGAMVRLHNGARVFVEKPKPETGLNDPVSVIIETVDIEKMKIEAQQL